MTTTARSIGQTEAARAADINEDCFLADDAIGLYLVCDGAGHSTAGDSAAILARDAVAEYVGLQTAAKQGNAARVSTGLVDEAVHLAFDAVLTAAGQRPELRGLHTTLTMLLIRDHRAIVGHVGDSRLYVVRGEKLHQLTLDHPWTGTPAPRVSAPAPDVENIDVDVFEFLMQPHDVFILCTDGLNPVLEDEAWIVELVQGSDPRDIAEQLLQREKQLDVQEEVDDDATVVVVRLEDGPDRVFAHHLPVTGDHHRRIAVGA